MNAIKYDNGDDTIFVGIILWFAVILLLVVTPYIMGGYLLWQNHKLSLRVDQIEQTVVRALILHDSHGEIKHER